jgi:IstB-like ATP binding protein
MGIECHFGTFVLAAENVASSHYGVWRYRHQAHTTRDSRSKQHRRLCKRKSHGWLRVASVASSNLPFSKWEGIFKDPMTTAAAIDRLVHHCVILELNIPS